MELCSRLVSSARAKASQLVMMMIGAPNGTHTMLDRFLSRNNIEQHFGNVPGDYRRDREVKGIAENEIRGIDCTGVCNFLGEIARNTAN